MQLQTCLVCAECCFAICHRCSHSPDNSTCAHHHRNDLNARIQVVQSAIAGIQNQVTALNTAMGQMQASLADLTQQRDTVLQQRETLRALLAIDAQILIEAINKVIADQNKNPDPAADWKKAFKGIQGEC